MNLSFTAVITVIYGAIHHPLSTQISPVHSEYSVCSVLTLLKIFPYPVCGLLWEMKGVKTLERVGMSMCDQSNQSLGKSAAFYLTLWLKVLHFT